MTKIDVMLYSYKGKNLAKVVDSLLKNTDSDITIYVFDQHPLNRKNAFEDNRIVYKHIFWDIIQSPCEYRGSILDTSKADYILQISDDILINPGWDTNLIKFANENDAVISGNRNINLIQKDGFSLKPIYFKNNSYAITNYIDRNFVFASRSNWNCFKYPYYLKYNGEEEMLSLEFFLANKTIYQAPHKIYDDLEVRSLDNLYVPFSKDHNYNLVVDAINSRGNSFMAFHGLSAIKLLPLPYQTDDVSYNPYALDFQEIDARKFISKTKVIR